MRGGGAGSKGGVDQEPHSTWGLVHSNHNFPLLGAYAYSSTGRKWALMFETMLNNK